MQDVSTEVADRNPPGLEEPAPLIIEIPFPHRSLYAGSATEPLPIRMVGETATS